MRNFNGVETKLTKAEKSLYKDLYQEQFEWGINVYLSDVSLNTKKDRGVLASLIKKRMLSINEDKQIGVSERFSENKAT